MGKQGGAGRTSIVPPKKDHKNTKRKGVFGRVEYAAENLKKSGYNKSEVKYWRKTINELLNSGKIIEDKSSFFNPDDNTVHLLPNASLRTIYHEVGHFIDWNKRRNKSITTPIYPYFAKTFFGPQRVINKAFEEDLAHLSKEIGFKLSKDRQNIEGFDFDNAGILQKWWDRKGFDKMLPQQAGAFSDIISAMTKEKSGSQLVAGGHSKSYWDASGSKQAKEVFAQYVALRHTGDKKLLSEFKHLTPNLYRIMQKQYARVWRDKK